MSEVVARILAELHDNYPGVIEEWARQRADGNEDWPDYHSAAGLSWWLDSEVLLAEDWSRTDDTGLERALQQFCLTALQRLRARKDGDADYSEQ
jgi:hypothetical protein